MIEQCGFRYYNETPISMKGNSPFLRHSTSNANLHFLYGTLVFGTTLPTRSLPMSQTRRTGLHYNRHLSAALSLFVGCWVCAFDGELKASDASATFQRQIKPILARYCTQCHDADTTKSDLRLDTLDEDFDGPRGETWHDILNRVVIGEMPPQEADELPTAQRRILVGWIRNNLDAIEDQKRVGGETVVRRLTRYEYNNTLRDLTGIELNYSADLPPDSSSPNGFKNNGSALGISAIQMEYYLRAARKAMAKAIVTGPPPQVHQHHFETSSPSNTPKIKTPIGNRMAPGGRFFGKMLAYPLEGDFVVRVKASALIPDGQGIPRMRVSIGLRSDTVSPTKMLGEIDVSNPETSPEIYEFRGRMEEFPIPGHNPKFPGVTIIVSNAHDDGLPAEAPIIYPIIKLSRAESKQVTALSKERALILAKSEKLAYKDKGKLVRDITKAAESLQKHIEELRLIDVDSDAEIDLACRLFDVNNSTKKLHNNLREFSKARGIDYETFLDEFERENEATITDHQTIVAKFQHLTPLNRKDKDAIRALLPSEPPRSTLVLDTLEFEGPLYDQWPPETHQKLLPQLVDQELDIDSTNEPATREREPERARQAIKRFMERAFRRPVTKADIAYVFEFYNEVRPRSETFEEAIRETFVMILVSPEFLYQVEPSPAPETRLLTPHELATRLSYFLWSTTPDTELINLADSGELSKPAVIQTQVQRLLRSEQSSEFVTHFVDQWLDLSGIDRVAINPEYYPEFDNTLKASMREETRAFFAELLRHDLSALNLLDSDFLMLNVEMAKHYGVEGPKGSVFERVDLPHDSYRGGLLTQASVLLLNSTGEDSHPIRRGVWLRSRLLDDPPAPPPPDVPELDAQSAGAAGLSVRQQLEQHRKREACNDCHRGIDPWGIPFENFDAVGNFRNDALRVTPQKRKKIRVNVSSNSVLPNGTSIENINDLKAHLLTNEKRRFSRSLVSRLLEYSTGREIVFADRESVEMITDQFEADEYRLSDLIVAIVQSKLFQTK